MKELLDKIEKARKEKGLSIYKLTELSGLSENTIYNWYNKNSKPTIYALQAVCNVLDVSLASFFSNNENATLSEQEETLIYGFRRLSTNQKKLFLQVLNEFNKATHKNNRENS